MKTEMSTFQTQTEENWFLCARTPEMSVGHVAVAVHLAARARGRIGLTSFYSCRLGSLAVCMDAATIRQRMRPLAAATSRSFGDSMRSLKVSLRFLHLHMDSDLSENSDNFSAAEFEQKHLVLS